jgi:hypothetical protein
VRLLICRATVLIFAALLAHADTLVLRNGTSVGGSWAGVDAGQVSFLVKGQLQTYTRSDVLSVTFGPEARETDAAKPNSPVAGVVEPELIGVVYLQDAAGKLIPLERAKAQLKRRHWEVENGASPVRVKVGDKTTFVVSLANGIDPSGFTLAALETNKGVRRVKFTPEALAVNVTKFGVSSYGLTPANDLAAGEYAFIRKNQNELYCFGVGN